MKQSIQRTWLLVLILAVSAASLLTAKETKKSDSNQLDETKRAVHALNRLAFGPRPGDVEKIKAMGVDKWIELQLHPEKLDDSALDARLEPLRTLKMETREMVENFPTPQVLKAIDEGKMSMPTDPVKQAIYQSALERYRLRKQAQDSPNPNAGNPPEDPQMKMDDPSADGRARKLSPEAQERIRIARQNADDRMDGLLAMPPDKRFDAILKMDPLEREVMARRMSPEDRDAMFNGMNAEQRETLMALARPNSVVYDELQSGKLLRAIYSERQLDQVMTDFWFNHFNIFINKGADRYMVTAYERDVIRPHALGKFKDLLLATAHSPAMMFYLDNWQSVGPDSDFVKGARQRGGFRRGRDGAGGFGGGFGRPNRRPQNPQNQQQQQKRVSGLNENYAREVMELHTLGVDGGYTQKDVTELAKVLTGWTIREPRQGGGFEFNERRHQPGKKYVLGQTFNEGGEHEGEKALEMLARHPSTARFISKKLAMRFVSDDPPQSLIDKMAATFTRSDGDIREVLRTMFKSPEFWSPEAYRAKVKTPLEFVVSAARATGADVKDPQPLVQALNRMGMPLYAMQPPTGYSMKAEAWVNSAALLNRMNTGLQIGSGKLRGISVDDSQMMGQMPPSADERAVLTALEISLLHGDVSKQTHMTLEKQLSDPKITERQLDDPARTPNPGMIAGLILGSPEFQRR
jgi:uncharacterized protein (DUF1800 family)